MPKLRTFLASAVALGMGVLGMGVLGMGVLGMGVLGMGVLGMGVLGTATAAQAADFYAGKTITFINGLDAGSSSDLACRMFAQFIGKHIAGNPTVIVKNMPGTASIVATNFVGADAKKDGLTLACGADAPSLQLFHDPGLKVDLTKFDVISGDGDDDLLYIRGDVPPGMKTGQDLFKVPPGGLIYGGFATNSQKDVGTRSFLATLGITDYKYVTGFNGDPAGRAAIQQKFINLFSDTMTSWIAVTSKTIGASGEVIPVAQSGTVDASGKRIRDPRTPDVPTYAEFYQTHFGKPPSGPAWQVQQAVVGNVNVALNWLALPPGSPPAAVAAMRASIGPLNADPDFIAASDQLRGPGKREVPGTVVEKALHDYLNMAPDVLQAYSDIIKSGDAMAQKH